MIKIATMNLCLSRKNKKTMFWVKTEARWLVLVMQLAEYFIYLFLELPKPTFLVNVLFFNSCFLTPPAYPRGPGLGSMCTQHIKHLHYTLYYPGLVQILPLSLLKRFLHYLVS